MLVYFLIFLLAIQLINLYGKHFIKNNFLNKISTVLLCIFLIHVTYIANKFSLTFDLRYNYNQLINYLVINLFNTNWTNLFLLILIVIIYINFYCYVHTFSIAYFITSQSYFIYTLFIIIYILSKNCGEIYYIPIEKLIFFKNFLLDINMLLLNNLILIHPICTHFLYSFFVFLFFCKYFLLCWLVLTRIFTSTVKTIKHKNIFILLLYFKAIKSNLYFTFIAYLAIFLGSIWAAQELIWNNWWSWDIIEIIAFSFFIVLVLYLHSFKKKTCYFQYYIYIDTCLILFTLFYFFIRLDISASLHSFNLFDSIEIYFYFFCLIFILLNYFTYKSKLLLLQILTHLNYLKIKTSFNKTILYLYKTLTLIFYFYCFVIWINDTENYIVKNEIIWIYSLICKFIIIYAYILYYWYSAKFNWLFFISITLVIPLGFYGWSILKKLYKITFNLFLLLHGLVFLFVLLIFFYSSLQILNYNVLYNKVSNLILLNKKLLIFYWNNNHNLLQNLLLSNIISFKFLWNSSLLFKYDFVTNDNFDIVYWQEQTYNYYLTFNIFENILMNFFYRENIIQIFINKNLFYVFLNLIFLYYLIKVVLRKKSKFWFFY